MATIFFGRTQNALARLRLAFFPLIPGIIQDLRGNLVRFISDILRHTNLHKDIKAISVKFGIVKNNHNDHFSDYSIVNQYQVPEEKPIIFASYCASADFGGNLKFCGGTKELNYLVKLLRERGYEAYIVTYDGTYEPWLLDHQPHISLDKFQQIVSENSNVRCVTSLATATAFIQASPYIYFWDMELAYTEQDFSVLAKLYRNKIVSTAAISRTIQAWHMANFHKLCAVLPNLIDTSFWLPSPSIDKAYRVGFMDEGTHTQEYINIVKNITQNKGLELEFIQIKGIESEVMAGMQSCEVFLSMNIGKDKLWGEGCPRTVIESLGLGCIVIAFDIIGNREIIIDNFNSIIVPRYHPEMMAEKLVNLYTLPGELERLRTNSSVLIQYCHTFEARWTAVKQFLHL